MRRSIIRVLLMLSVVLSGLVNVLPAAAQDLEFELDYFGSDLTGLEIELTRSDFEITGATVQSYPGGEGEIIQIRSDDALIQVAFYDDSDTNLETMELYNSQFSEDVDEYEVLDQVDGGEVVTTFARASIQGQDILYFISVTEDVEGNADLLEAIYAPEATFVDGFAEAQDTISIDGGPFLADADVAELEEIADGGGRGSGSTRDRDDEDDSRTRSRDQDDQDESDSRTRSRDRDDEEGNDQTRSREDREDDSRTRPRDQNDKDEDPDDRSTRSQTSGETYEFEVVPGEITVSGDVQLVGTEVDAPGVEQVRLEVTGTNTIALVQLVRARTSAEATLDQILENVSGAGAAFENIGTGADATSAWSLDAATSGGQREFILIYVETDRYPDYHYVEVMVTTEANFFDHLDAFSLGVEIDGEAMFTGLDKDELDALLNGGVTPDGPADPDDDEDKGNSGTSGRRTDARIETGEDPDRTRERSRDREDSGEEAAALDLESQGLVSESEFESLQHGYVVEWDETVWSVDMEWELSATSDEESEIDSVILFWLDGNASMLIQIMPSFGGVPADFVGVWESDDYVVDSVHEDAEILIADSGRSTGAVVYLTFDNNGDELILVQEVIDIDGGDTVAIVTMFASPDDVADAYADAEDLVSVDGLELVGTFTAREIDRAVAP